MENKKANKYKRLSESERVNIIASYMLDKSNNNIQKICNDYNISKQTIYNLVKKKDLKEKALASISESVPNFTKRIDTIIDTALDKIEYKLQYEDGEKTTYRDLAIMIGTLYDKSRLEKNLSTENKAVEINIKVEH